MKIKNTIKTAGLCLALAVAGCNKAPKDILTEYYLFGDFNKYTGMIVRKLERDYLQKTAIELQREYKPFTDTISFDEARKLEGLGRKVYFCDSNLPD